MMVKTEVLRCLHELGVDLTKPCDSMGYGSPAFWAAKYGREHILLELFNLGIDLNGPCERYGKDPKFMAAVCGNHNAIDRVDQLRQKRNFSAAFIQALLRGVITRTRASLLRRQYAACAIIQKRMRGEVVRIQRGFGIYKQRTIGQRVARRQIASVKIEALVRGGVVRLKMF
mmetsp:Transcript_28259/g.36556  ORF Transcript_28259/g.36556 Transcript_28259/m.36556 type:complete len:172 (-) Transcript_28259:163-678(-)